MSSGYEALKSRGAEIKASGRPMNEVLDELIQAPDARYLETIATMVYAYDLGLGEAKLLVGNRCFELKHGRELEASRRWVKETSEAIKVSGPREDWMGHLLADPGSGFTAAWEPTGFTEKAEVVAAVLEISYGEAVSRLVDRNQKPLPT